MNKRIRKGQSFTKYINFSLPSPEEKLCEISMLQYQNQCKSYNGSKQLQKKSQYNNLDGWVRIEQKSEHQSMHQISPSKSHLQNYQELASPIYSNFSNRRLSTRIEHKLIKTPYLRQEYDSRKEMHRSNSHEISNSNRNEQFKIGSKQVAKKGYVRSKSAHMVKDELNMKNQMEKEDGKRKILGGVLGKVILQSVAYPIFIESVQSKRLIPNIGRVRHLINNKGRLKF